MKKIAMLTDGWKRMVAYAWVEGMVKRQQELGEDVCIYQYNCYGNWRNDTKYNCGEYNIFHLPELNEFDGVVLDCNFMSDREWQQNVITMIKKVKVPVISIGYAIDGCYYIGIDNKTPMKQMMKHLHEHHKCTRFLYAGGPKRNYENYSRMKAFQEYLQENGLNKEEQPVWFGDYDYETGIKYMNRLVEEGKPLPDVVVCANDNIAAGLCERAEELGLSVPEDFRVTGFDNMEKAAYFYPQITTIENDRNKIAGAVIDMFHDLWNGKKVDCFHFVPTHCVFGESCGCSNNGLVDYRKHLRDQIAYQVKSQKEDERRVAMEVRMAECTDFNGIFHEMAKYIAHLDCDGFYAVVDKKLFEGCEEQEFLTQGYAKGRMVVAYAMEEHQRIEISEERALDEYLATAQPGTAYMFTPLHFRQYTVGYTIVKNARFLSSNPYFCDAQSGCTRAMEALFKHIQLEKINHRLEEVYNRDPMTGLYNRMAYTEMIEPAFEKYKEEHIPCCLAFFDVNKFKEINDTMGHEFGDTLLKHMARILLDKRPKDGFVYRFGGDEFVVFFPNADEELAKAYRREILQETETRGISVSIGIVVTDPESDASLDDYLGQADTKMYEMKREGR